ncbi:MAG: hypothetical protein ACXW1Y_13425 [Acidimicrobiia bacterium]
MSNRIWPIIPVATGAAALSGLWFAATESKAALVMPAAVVVGIALGLVSVARFEVFLLALIAFRQELTLPSWE